MLRPLALTSTQKKIMDAANTAAAAMKNLIRIREALVLFIIDTFLFLRTSVRERLFFLMV